MGDNITKIISWNINPYHNASIWIKNDHTGYVLFYDKIIKGEFTLLKDACNKMDELVGF